MSAPTLPIVDRLSALADATRGRLLFVLERHELTVGELCSILQLPQSTVSRHLKVLADDGWVASRADGTSRRYRLAQPDDPARRLWQVVRESLAVAPGAAHDLQRLDRVLAERRTRSRDYFRGVAGEWDRVRAELFGGRADLLALLALLDDRMVVGDLGCGTGAMTEALAPAVARVIAVDDSEAMLGAARARLDGIGNTELRAGSLEALPIDDGALDAAVLSLVLHYVPEPLPALAEAARALRPGGKLLVVDMLPHDREDMRVEMGHVWPGFDEPLVAGWLAEAGFARVRYRALPPEPQAKGPGLFVCTAMKGTV
jgi:ubiquinone/menaquinone biosynthesis C-methylase UbiE